MLASKSILAILCCFVIGIYASSNGKVSFQGAPSADQASTIFTVDGNYSVSFADNMLSFALNQTNWLDGQFWRVEFNDVYELRPGTPTKQDLNPYQYDSCCDSLLSCTWANYSTCDLHAFRTIANYLTYTPSNPTTQVSIYGNTDYTGITKNCNPPGNTYGQCAFFNVTYSLDASTRTLHAYYKVNRWMFATNPATIFRIRLTVIPYAFSLRTSDPFTLSNHTALNNPIEGLRELYVTSISADRQIIIRFDANATITPTSGPVTQSPVNVVGPVDDSWSTNGRGLHMLFQPWTYGSTMDYHVSFQLRGAEEIAEDGFTGDSSYTEFDAGTVIGISIGVAAYLCICCCAFFCIILRHKHKHGK